MNSGIYKLGWENGYFYIGQSVNVNKRWMQHKSNFYRGSMEKSQSKLFAVWNKYGLPTFTIIKNCSIESLNDLEQLYITANWGNPKFCNTSPSSVNTRGVKRTKPSWQKGKKFTVIHKKNLSLSHKEMIGTKNNNHKLTEIEVNEIRQKYIPFKCGSVALAKEYNVSYRTILNVVNNKRYWNLPLYDTSTHKEVLKNKGAKMYEYKGISKSLREWSIFLNINHGTLESRLCVRKGRKTFTTEEAFEIINHTKTDKTFYRAIINKIAA